MKSIPLRGPAYLVLASSLWCCQAPQNPTPESTQPTLGIDVSHHNGVVSWLALRDSGLAFAYVKASQGTSYRDPSFAAHWSKTSQLSIPRGAYHFFDPRTDPARQAKHFLKVVGSDAGELPPVVDVERGAPESRHGCERLTRSLRIFVDVVEAALDRKMMIYTGHRFWKERACDTTDFGDRGLWIASYGATQPHLPTGWQHWTLWQYSPKGKIGDIEATFDVDRFGGSRAEFTAWLESVR